MIIFDIESNGLTDDVSKIWCIVAYDTSTDTYQVGRHDDQESMSNIIDLLSGDNILVGHNIIGYDLPVLRKLTNIRNPKRVIDTYVVSRLFNPDRGFHSLADWGERLGVKKVEQEQWLEWDPNMLHRCKEDVRINTLLYHRLSEECGEDLCKHVYS